MIARKSRRRALIALIAVATSTVGLVSPVRIQRAAAAPAGLVVLDPDDNYSHAVWAGQSYTELPITYQIAVQAKAKLQALCDTSVVITRDASQNYVSRSARAAMMTNATVSMTLSLNNLNGTPWGTATDGGSIAFASNYTNDIALANRTLQAVTQFTGRPNAGGANQGGTNGTTYPYPEFANLPGTYSQAFLLYMDHNFDWPAVDGTYDNLQYGYLTDAVVTAIGQQLQAQGITCGNASAGQSVFPTAPSQAQLAALFALGFANYMRYGADPINFATGNFLQSADLFSLSGPGGTSTDIGLTYNSLDGRAGRFGNGWSSGLDDRSQTYADQSVLITGSDGSATSFNRNPDGSYAAPTGVYARLARTATHTLVETQPDGSTETFAEDQISGAGVMTARTDRGGHVWSYGYTSKTVTIPGGPSVWPVAPDGSSGGPAPSPFTYTTNGALASITDPGGQVITLTADSAGRVNSVARPDGATWQINYDGSGNLTAITDANGHTTRYGYDSSSRMTTITDPADHLHHQHL